MLTLLVQRLFNEKGTLFLEDLTTEPSLHAVAETFLVRSILLFALVREGRPVGMLTLDEPGKIRTFSPEQIQLARAISQQAAMAIDNARLYQQAQAEKRRAEQLIDRARAIYQVALAVNSGEDLPTVLEIANNHLIRRLNADGGSIALLNNETLQLAISSKQQEEFPKYTNYRNTVSPSQLLSRSPAWKSTFRHIRASRRRGNYLVP